MSFAQDSSVSVHVETGDSHHLGIDRDNRVGLDHHAVEPQLHPALPHKVPRILVVFEPADQVAIVGKNGASVPLGMAHSAQDRIADGCRSCRELRL
jgi:hypothetical protein